MQISTRSYCYLLVWFGFVALCSQLTPYFANDYRYVFIQGTEQFVNSLSDIVVSQYNHYFEWGGRTVAHTIAQILLYIGKPASSVVQASCYILLILFIYYNAYGVAPTLRLRFRPLFVITLGLFLQLRMYGEVVFNIVSSANYLYTTTIVLMFLLPFRISMKRELDLKNENLALVVPMAILGLMAGWSNENTAAAMATFLGLYLLYNFKEKRLKTWQVVGYVFFLIGFALLVFSPGNAARLDSMEDKGFDYLDHTLGAVDIFFESLLACSLLIILTVYIILRVFFTGLYVHNLRRFNASLWFILMGLFSLVLMIFSPNFPARSATPFVVFTLVGMQGLTPFLMDKYEHVLPKIIEQVMLYVCSFLTLLFMVNAIWGNVILRQDVTLRESEISQQLEAGKKDLVVSPFRVNTYKYIFVADVRSNPNYWTNKIVKNFLKVDSIRRSCDYPKRPLDHDFVPIDFFSFEKCITKDEHLVESFKDSKDIKEDSAQNDAKAKAQNDANAKEVEQKSVSKESQEAKVKASSAKDAKEEAKVQESAASQAQAQEKAEPSTQENADSKANE